MTPIGSTTTHSLAVIFKAVGEALKENQQMLNQADPVNANHGDHMVEVFRLAELAADGREDSSLAEALEHAAELLEDRTENGSAQIYAHGLRRIGEQIRRFDVSLAELLSVVKNALIEEKGEQKAEQISQLRSGEVLKALLSGLAGWSELEEGKTISGEPLSMGRLFEFGMAYMQAKMHASNRIDILANSAVTVSPLVKIPHRYQSGQIALRALLGAMVEETI